MSANSTTRAGEQTQAIHMATWTMPRTSPRSARRSGCHARTSRQVDTGSWRPDRQRQAVVSVPNGVRGRGHEISGVP